VSACDKFIYTEILAGKEDEDSPGPARPIASLQDKRLMSLLRNAVEASSDDAGWSFLGMVGSSIAKQAPEFDSRNYGYPKLSGLIEASKLFEVDRRKTGDGSTTSIYVRAKPGRTAK